MRILFILPLFLWACASPDPTLQPAVIEKVACTVNFADFKAPLDVNSKLYRSAEQEVRDETERVVTQRAILKSGEEVLFKGGGCAHIAYSFTYTKLKPKKKDTRSMVKLASTLISKTPMTDTEKARPLGEALKAALKKNAKEIVEGQYELDCGNANCSLDYRESEKIILTYDLAI